MSFEVLGPTGCVEILRNGEWKSVMLTDHVEYGLRHLVAYPEGTEYRYRNTMTNTSRDITDLVEDYRREHND